MDFFEDITPGENATPPAADPQPAESTAPASTDSEVVTNPDKAPEQTIPFHRFQEVNDKAKLQEAELATFRQEKAERESQVTPPAVGSPEAEAAEARSQLKALGFVPKDELDKDLEARIEARLASAEAKTKFETDLAALQAKYKDFDREKVLQHIQETVGTVKSKDAIEAAYFYLNRDSILENERKRAIAEAAGGGKGAAETPGQGGSKEPTAPDLKGKSMKELIHAAHEAAKAGQT